MDAPDGAIAVVGMAGRFPGSQTIDALWQNLLADKDCIGDFDRESLRGAGTPHDVIEHPDFVPAFGTLPDADCFDAEFFGYSPKEAALIDPQQRLFLQCVWHGLESAGRNPRENPEKVGVFAGSSMNKYLLFNLLRNPATYPAELLHGEDLVPAFAGADHIASRIAFKLGLHGPSIAVSAACAGSLVAVVLACQSLRALACDVAIAGGVSVSGRGPRGYFAKKGGMASRRGRCRSFDAAADGSVFGDGVGCVVLKRAEDARRNGDTVLGYLRGWATNNDGSQRVGFAAPSARGQEAVIRAAMTMANVAPAEVGYVEGHGSGTRVGDPIEFAALRNAFKVGVPSAHRTCGLGSIKSNIGHLDAAAGIAGLIKTLLCVREGVIPATLHFSSPNPDIPLNESPFFVNATAEPFPGEAGKPRIAGVSSFGIGGFNAHIIVQEAGVNLRGRQDTDAGLVVIPIGAASPGAMSRQLRSYRHCAAETQSRRQLDFALGAAIRARGMAYRAAAIGSSWTHIAAELESLEGRQDWARIPDEAYRVVFMYPGVGQQYPGMCAQFYSRYPVFRAAFDACAAESRKMGVDIGWALAEQPGQTALISRGAARGRPELTDTATSHAALFAAAFAMTRLLEYVGVRPDVVVGHSLGELIACGAAGVLELQDVLRLIIERARVSDSAGAGAMIALPISPADAEPYCRDGVQIAIVNTPNQIVLAGPVAAIDTALERLRQDGVLAVALPARTAFHSEMLATAAGRLTESVEQCGFSDPQVAFHSTSRGERVGAQQLSQPEYWAGHLCRSVQWSQSIEQLMSEARSVFVEVGVGTSLCEFAEEIARSGNFHEALFVPTIANSYLKSDALAQFLRTLSRLWCAGGEIAWPQLYEPCTGGVTSLPAYPFERTSFWIDSRYPGPTQFPPEATPGMTAEPLTKARKPVPEPIVREPPLRTELERVPATIEGGAPQPQAGTSPLQQVLLEVWSAQLGREVGINDDFFRIGGSSLMALQLTSAMWRAVGLEIPVRRILEQRTIARLCQGLELPAGGAPVQGVLAARLANLPHSRQAQAVMDWVFQVIEGEAVQANARDPDARLNQEQLRAAIPDLIHAFRREFQAPFYPGEFYERATVRSIAELALLTLQKRQPAAPRLLRTGGSLQQERIGRAALVVSSVRSGSTLLRVMLAGHSQLFCPPELHLLEYATMHERATQERSPDRDQGLERCFVELLADPDAGARKLELLNRHNVPTAEVLQELIALSAPRLLVDKSPGNSNRIETLRRAEQLFDRPFYIFLVRHPYSVIESVAKNRFVQMLEYGTLDPYVLGELLWQRSNANILEHLSTIEDERKVVIRYEDLVQCPEAVMRSLTDHMGIGYEDSLLTPYHGKRMRDGLGDPNLSQHSGIRADLSDAWKHASLRGPLGSPTRFLARELGYELALRDCGPQMAGRSNVALSPVISPPMSATVAGPGAGACELVLLSDSAHTVETAPIVICCHALDGTVDLYRALADELAGHAIVYGLAQMEAAADRPTTDLRELCQPYTEVVREFMLNRRVCLCGWSFGGVLAFELARHFSIAHAGAPDLVLIDTPAPGSHAAGQPGMAAAALHYAHAIAAAAGKTFMSDSDAVLRMSAEVSCTHVAQQLVRQGLIDANLFSGEFDRRVRRFEVNSRVVRNYNPQKFVGSVTLIRANKAVHSDATAERPNNCAAQDGDRGWASLVSGRLTVQQLNASHYTMMSYPHVASVASFVKEAVGSA